MRFELDRTTIVLVIFLLIVGGIFGINQFVNSRPPIEIDVVVDPLAEDWMTSIAGAYNSSNAIVNGTTPVRVNIQVMDDLDVWRGNPGWNSDTHPDAWMPSSSLSLDYAPSSLPFDIITESVAYTPLVWGGFQNRVDVITANGAEAFDWDSAQAVTAGTSWADGGFVNMAINWPTGSMSGLGVLTTAIASYQDDTAINRAVLSDAAFTDWFASIEESVRNSERLGGNPAQVMASRGTSAADFALLPESQWLSQIDSLNENGTITFAYPAYQFPLDFPLAVWSGNNTDNTRQAAVTNFANFLVSAEARSITLEQGFRPANTVLDESADLFVRAGANGILLETPLAENVIVTDRGLVDSIILLLN